MWSVPRCFKQHIRVNCTTDNRLTTAVTLENDRSVLSSERAPHINKPVTVRQ
jgi:hypothetical protein